MPLSVLVRNKLNDWRREYYSRPTHYGLKGSTRQSCRHSKRKKPFRKKNNITRHKWPKWLKMYHIEWMLLHDRVIPKGKVISHGCLDLNPKKKSRRKEDTEWNKCFEATHLDPLPQDRNKLHDKCHKVLRDFYVDSRADKKSKRAKGTITVSDVARITGNSELKCPNSKLECFANFGN